MFAESGQASILSKDDSMKEGKEGNGGGEDSRESGGGGRGKRILQGKVPVQKFRSIFETWAVFPCPGVRVSGLHSMMMYAGHAAAGLTMSASSSFES
jgi:hypothetical protein